MPEDFSDIFSADVDLGDDTSLQDLLALGDDLLLTDSVNILDEDQEQEEEPGPLDGIKKTGDFETDKNAEASAMLQLFIQRRKAEEARLELLDTEFWVVLCFYTREEVEDFVRKIGMPTPQQKYLSGYEVAEKLGVKINRYEGLH